jgi:hypothetical protein
MHSMRNSTTSLPLPRTQLPTINPAKLRYPHTFSSRSSLRSDLQKLVQTKCCYLSCSTNGPAELSGNTLKRKARFNRFGLINGPTKNNFDLEPQVQSKCFLSVMFDLFPYPIHAVGSYEYYVLLFRPAKGNCLINGFLQFGTSC